MNSKDKILLVDDEPNILEGYKRQLHNKFLVETAIGPTNGLEIFKKKGPFSIIVSDLKMPEMNGIEFLAEIKKQNPNSIRIMLTGQADLEDAISAVNEGNIFRFLTKPCSTEILIGALKAGIQQSNLIKSEKILLEKTLRGSIKVLTEILSLVSPVAFGRANRIKSLIVKMAKYLNLTRIWELEIAALLSQIGCVTIPDGTLSKAYQGLKLSEEENAMFKVHPSIGEKLISNIPRLERVSSIILNQNKSHKVLGTLENDISIKSKILNIVLDYDTLAISEKDQGIILSQIIKREKDGLYDLMIVKALKDALEIENAYETKSLMITELTTNMILAENVVTTEGKLLIAKGQEITESLKIRLKNISNNLDIKEPVQVYLF